MSRADEGARQPDPDAVLAAGWREYSQVVLAVFASGPELRTGVRFVRIDSFRNF